MVHDEKRTKQAFDSQKNKLHSYSANWEWQHILRVGAQNIIITHFASGKICSRLKSFAFRFSRSSLPRRDRYLCNGMFIVLCAVDVKIIDMVFWSQQVHVIGCLDVSQDFFACSSFKVRTPTSRSTFKKELRILFIAKDADKLRACLVSCDKEFRIHLCQLEN